MDKDYLCLYIYLYIAIYLHRLCRKLSRQGLNDPLTGQCTEIVPSLHCLHCPLTHHTEPGRHLPGWRTTIIGEKVMLTPTSNNTVRVFIGPWETCMSVAWCVELIKDVYMAGTCFHMESWIALSGDLIVCGWQYYLSGEINSPCNMYTDAYNESICQVALLMWCLMRPYIRGSVESDSVPDPFQYRSETVRRQQWPTP